MREPVLEVYCRNCGVRLRSVLGRWWHTAQLGPVRCERPEPEPPSDGSGER